jgi:hypothetical protein
MRPKYIVVGEKPGAWQWRLVGEDGQAVARSMGHFPSPAAASRAAQAARALAAATVGASAAEAPPAAAPPAAAPPAAAPPAAEAPPPEADPAEAEPPADQSMDVVIRRLVKASRARAAD